MLRAATVFGAAFAFVGCAAKPSATNIKLRVQVQSLKDDVAALKSQHAGDLATIDAMKSPATTQPQLSGADADALFTTHGIRFGKLTGGANFDPAKSGDGGLKVYVTPFDEEHDDFKAAGSITVEAFDLAADKTELGKWYFSTADAKKLWNGQAILYEYIVPCLWQTMPMHEDVTVKVTFVDALTGRSFTEQKLVKIKLPSP